MLTFITKRGTEECKLQYDIEVIVSYSMIVLSFTLFPRAHQGIMYMCNIGFSSD